jgi:RNA polymerase sigma factor (sigma-70 family)
MAAAGLISSNWKNTSNTLSEVPCTESDEKLVSAAKQGHTVAFDELYKRHAEKMFRATHRITRNREDAEDAVQECFLNAFIHLRSFDGKSRFSTWLTRIAMNAALMRLRKNRAGREIPLDDPVGASQVPEHQLRDSSLNPEERYAKSEREVILRDEAAKLRPGIRKAVQIHLQDCSLDETAEILGITVTAAKARLFQARVALRRASQLQFVLPSIWTNSEPGSQPAR